MKRLPWQKAAPFLLVACVLAYTVPQLFLSTAYPPYTDEVDYSVTLASSTQESLAYYAQAHRLDPIFAIEGTDPEKLRSAIEALFAEKDRLLAMYSAQDSSIGRTIYPTSFLANLPKLEEARQALLKEPTTLHAGAYHYLLEETIAYYARDARALANSLMQTDKRTPALGYLAGTASTTDIAAKMNTVATLALQQKKKEADRFACLAQLSADCTPLTQLRSEREARLAAPRALPAPGADVYKVAALTQRIIPHLSYFGSSSHTILAIRSTCYFEPVAYGQVYRLEPYQGGVARKFSYVTNAYFRDIAGQMQVRQTPLYTALKEAGVTLTYQNVGNMYNCPDSGLDIAETGALIGVLDALNKKDVKTPAEQQLLARPAVQRADLTAHLQDAAQLDTRAGDALVERYVQGSFEFDQVVLSVHSDNRFLEVWNREQSVVSFEFLLTSRNFASVLFLLGNPTFVPERISLFTSMVQNPLDKLLLRDYLTDVSKEYTDEQLLDQIKTATEMEARMGLRPR